MLYVKYYFIKQNIILTVTISNINKELTILQNILSIVLNKATLLKIMAKEATKLLLICFTMPR